MKKEFTIDRQGKTFVLYAGLLDLAHERGLISITTDIVQVPSEANNRVAICTATVTLEKDGVVRSFTGIGDAAPNNVAPAMQTALIRMSETRAKARALRDAVNVGASALEELGEGTTGNDTEEYRPQSRAGRSSRAGTVPGRAAAGTGRASGKVKVLNQSGQQCPHCHAPDGAAHGDTCEIVKERAA